MGGRGGKVRVWLQALWERFWFGLVGRLRGKGYGQGYRVMVMLMVRLGRYGYGLASWVGFSGMVMVRLRG